MTTRTRLDLLVARRGLAESRERAQALIMAGSITVGGKRVDKPGTAIADDAEVALSGPDIPYVGRGGLKLEHALDTFGLDVRGQVAVDIGSSTGGFTDCLLQRGASRVYAVDAGRGQLHAALRADPRVVVMEETNARYLTTLPERPTVATFDVSFISLLKVIPAVTALLAPAAVLVALIKPQFEAGAALVGKGGVVRRPEVRRTVVSQVLSGMAALGLPPRGLTVSPLRGPAGNVEYLTYATVTCATLGAATEPAGIDALVAAVSWT
jgi:23S rRNA (cytidine1920-2'-O)/16S rRNA (cytidine1409-2'-O)-methyltransferase